MANKQIAMTQVSRPFDSIIYLLLSQFVLSYYVTMNLLKLGIKE